jgi:ABC-2 type transport system permease protein
VKIMQTLIESLKTRKFRFGGYAAVLTLALAAGLVLVNLTVQQLPVQFDLTKSGLFSLTEQTEQVLKNLKSDVKILILHEPGKEPATYKEVLDRYVKQSSRVKYEVIDPEKNPGLLAKYKKDEDSLQRGSLIVTGEKGFKLIKSFDLYDVNYQDPNNPQATGFSVEKRLTGAILFVASGVTPVVYEISGHNEPQLKQLGINTILERENFDLKQLSLLKEAAVPKDAAMLVLNAPRSDLSKGETEKLLAYLNGGGRLLIMADFQSGDIKELNDLLSSYGVNYNFGVVVEQDKNYSTGSPFMFRPDYESHDIMAPLTRNQIDLILQFSQGIKTLETKRRTVEIFPLLKSSNVSFLRTDLRNESPIKSGSDLPGPVVMAAAIKDSIDYNTGKEARLVVVGAGKLLEPLLPYGRIPGNTEFFMNAVGWLADRKESITVNSKSLITFPMRLSEIQIIVFAALFVLIIPIALFAAGLVVWLKRRHL